MQSFFARMNADYNRFQSQAGASQSMQVIRDTIVKDSRGFSVKHRDGRVSSGYGSGAKALMDVLMDEVVKH